MEAPTIKTRNDFPKLIRYHELRHGVELGVAAGDFSEVLLSSCLYRLISIDRWNDHHGDEEYFQTISRLDPYPESLVMRATFSAAAVYFTEDRHSFDLIYIDGYAHEGQENGETLETWWPLLRSGGVFAGHDYHPRWQPTIDVVDAFMRKRGLTFRVTEEKEPEFPSWWAIKP